MKTLNYFLKICLDIADYYDNKGNADTKYLGDEMTKEIGYGYRALTSYLRDGVREVISLQKSCHKAHESMNYFKTVQKEQKEYFLDVFGDEEPYTFNDEYKQRIKDCVRGIIEEIEEEE